MMPISISYAFLFAFLGIYSSLVSLHFTNIGITGEKLAFFFTLIPSISFVFNLVWGRVADQLECLKKLNIYLPLIGAIAYCYGIFVNTYESFLVMAVFTGIIINPIFALSDSLTIGYCKKSKASFGNLRQWGTIAFSAINFIVSFVLYFYLKDNASLKNETVHQLLYLMPFFLFLKFLSGYFLPDSQIKEEKMSAKQFLKMMTNQSLLLFFIACMFHSMASVANYVYFSPQLKKIGATTDFITVCWAVSPIFEIFIFRYSHVIINNFSLSFLFRFSVLAAVVRYFIVGSSNNLTLILLSQTLHTFVFGTYFLSTIHILMRHIPEHIRSSSQGFFTSFSGMLGLVISNFIMGKITASYPTEYVFYTACCFSGSAFIISLFIPKNFWNHQVEIQYATK